MFNLAEEYKVLNLFSNTTVTADDVTDTGVNVEAYEDDALVVLQVGSMTSTSATFAINVTASTALAGTYSDIGTFTTFNNSAIDTVSAIPVSLAGDNKYVKLDIDTTGYSPNAIIGAVILVKPQVAQSGINSATPA